MERSPFKTDTNVALTKAQLLERIDKDFFIRPLLDPEGQIQNIGIDFRLGYDFLVAIQGREAVINASLNSESGQTDINEFFQPTRRQLGETFILHPNQTVLATTLEFVKLPDDIFLMLFMRSSYSRLGLSVSTIVQPGFCGCISIELNNQNHTPVNLTVGARVLQAVAFSAPSPTSYFSKPRKYMCNVRPEPSAVIHDLDLELLNQLWMAANNR
jgi:dCTP deaminase